MKYISGNQGFTTRVYLLLIVLLLLIGIPCALPYYHYYGILWYTDNMIKINAGNTKVIRKEILSYASRKGIPLLNQNVQVTSDGKRTRVNLYWDDVIDHFGYHQKPVTFVINDEF